METIQELFRKYRYPWKLVEDEDGQRTMLDANGDTVPDGAVEIMRDLAFEWEFMEEEPAGGWTDGSYGRMNPRNDVFEYTEEYTEADWEDDQFVTQLKQKNEYFNSRKGE